MANNEDRPVVDLKNIGPTSAHWLNDVGLYTLVDLEQVGAVEAYSRIAATGQRVSLNLVYALQGALLNIHWNDLPSALLADLRRAIKDLNK